MKVSNTSLRLKALMSDRNLRQTDILELCRPICKRENVKIQKSDLSQYISGKVEPRQDKLSILATALNVSEAWLMGFDVPMEDTTSAVLPSAIPLGSYKIPVVATVAAGKPIYTEDSILEYIDYYKDGNGQVFAMYIQGDSMEPKIHSGDLVVVDQSIDYQDGDIVVVSINGNDGCCKRIKIYKDSIALVSLNSAYEPMYFSSKEVNDLPVKVVGKVIESRSRF